MLEQVRQKRDDLTRDASVLNPIVSAGVGGLNLVDGALKTALTDSTIARNVSVGNDGVLRRRPGTRLLGRQATDDFNGTKNAVNHKVVTTPNGHDFLFGRLGRTMVIRNLQPTRMVGTYKVDYSSGFTVLPASTGDVEGTIVVLKDPRIRVLTFLPTCPTIETRVNEVRYTGDGTATLTVPRSDLEQLIPGIYPSQTIQDDQICVFKNGTRVLPDSITIGSTDITVTFSTTNTTNDLLDLVLFQSYWWAESELYYGDRFADTVTRTNTDTSDVHVPVPANLRDAIEQRGDSKYDQHTLNAYYWTGSNYSQYTQSSDGTPTGSTEFSLSDGTNRINSSPVTPSPLFLTFGSTVAGLPQPVVLARHRRLNHRGGRGAAGSTLNVRVDNQTYTYTPNSGGITVGNVPSFRIFDNEDNQQITSASDEGFFISLDGQWQSEPEINPSSVVRITSTFNEYAPQQLGRVPVYGFTTVCDYGAGSFPSCGATYQNRLVVGGMPHDPLLVAFSALYDSRTPSEPYMYFQNDALDLNPETSAFQVRLDSTPDDRIVSIQEFQGSLFVLTYRGVFRIAAPGRTVISSTNYFVSSVANVGAVSANAVCRPEGSIAFLSPRGLFAIVNGVQSNEATEYKLVELSTKIAAIFDRSLSPQGKTNLWWASYASEERRIYVGLTQPGDEFHCSLLYTYDMLNQAWSSMDTVGGFRTYHGFDAQLERDRSYHYMVVDVYTDGDFHLVGTGEENHLDYQQDFEQGTDIEYLAPRYPITNVTTIYGRDADRNLTVGYIYKVAAPFSPLTGIKDIKVELDGVQLTEGEQYEKLEGGYILINQDTSRIERAESLVITRVDEDGLTTNSSNLAHLAIIADGIPFDQVAWYRLNDDTLEYNKRTWRATLDGDFTRTVGVMFQSVWVSPVITLGQITSDKRLDAVTLYMERIPTKQHWFGTRTEYNANYWPGVAIDTDAGTDPTLTDVPLEPYDARVGVITDQDQSLDSLLNLTTERDFNDPDEEITGVGSPTPHTLQRGLGVAIRRSLKDIVSVFQVALVSKGARPFGISAMQVEASVRGSKQVNRSR